MMINTSFDIVFVPSNFSNNSDSFYGLFCDLYSISFFAHMFASNILTKFITFLLNHAGVISGFSKELAWRHQIILKMIAYQLVVVLVLLGHVQKDPRSIPFQYHPLT